MICPCSVRQEHRGHRGGTGQLGERGFAQLAEDGGIRGGSHQAVRDAQHQVGGGCLFLARLDPHVNDARWFVCLVDFTPVCKLNRSYEVVHTTYSYSIRIYEANERLPIDTHSVHIYMYM